MSVISFPLFAADKQNIKLNKILQRPLIVGASVSADHLSPSPGKVLALRYTDAKDIKVIARGGTLGREVVKYVSESTMKDRSAIIGLDLFFWDSFSSAPLESLQAVDKIVDFASQKNIPIVLGEVPALIPFRQNSLGVINKKIKEACQKYAQCKILPLNALLQKTLLDGYILQGGKKHTLDSLIPDGLHIARPASEYLADQIQSLF